jgi:hypothetical protein
MMLALDNNNIGNVGAETLAEGLKDNSALILLGLSTNNNDEGALAMVGALKTNHYPGASFMV